MDTNAREDKTQIYADKGQRRRRGAHTKEVLAAEEDEIILRRVKKKEDWAKVWLECPVKTDQPLPKRNREYFRSKI